MTTHPTRRSLAQLSVIVLLGLATPVPGAAQPTAAPATVPPPAVAAGDEVEVTDFATEEAASDRQRDQVQARAGGDGAGNLGFKLMLDLLADYRLGQEKLVFRPNHFYALVQGNLKDDLGVMLHISETPVFYEITWNVTPTLSVKAGKLLVPFGTNEFHHLIGGRVDEESAFLPETWGDFGFGVQHLVYDGELVSVEYAAYAVNGFEGTAAPVIGAGDAADNNMSKGLGGRLKLALLGKVLATGSVYWDRWDPEDEYAVAFYSAGLEVRPGLIDLPVLRRVRLRGEWSRGEIQLPSRNYQTGLLPHYAYARTGYYGELQVPVHEAIALRARVGRINPDNTARGEVGANSVYEPAILFLAGKMSYTLAYQLVTHTGSPYRQRAPGDVLYAKFFLQY